MMAKMNVWPQVLQFWCTLTHPSPMWPVKGQYRCPKCLRVYPVKWETPNGHEAHRPASKQVLELRPREQTAAAGVGMFSVVEPATLPANRRGMAA
jgi:hypothetical protein